MQTTDVQTTGVAARGLSDTARLEVVLGTLAYRGGRRHVLGRRVQHAIAHRIEYTVRHVCQPSVCQAVHQLPVDLSTELKITVSYIQYCLALEVLQRACRSSALHSAVACIRSAGVGVTGSDKGVTPSQK
eukprot:1189469-Prorocentrum_minimum.AAC.2